jgi:hypothetical protein
MAVRRRKRTYPPRFRVVTLRGRDSARPRVVHLRSNDFVCFVNPTGTSFSIRFPKGTPLSRAVGVVRAGSPSRRWYQLSRRADYGVHYHYTVRTSGSGLTRGGPTGGPEIVPDG